MDMHADWGWRSQHPEPSRTFASDNQKSMSLKPGCRKVYFGDKVSELSRIAFKQYIALYGNQKRRTVTVVFYS